MSQEITCAEDLEEARQAVESWHRIAWQHDGRQKGFDRAVGELRRLSGLAFARGDDAEARALRSHAEVLQGSEAAKAIAAERVEAWKDYDRASADLPDAR